MAGSFFLYTTGLAFSLYTRGSWFTSVYGWACLLLLTQHGAGFLLYTGGTVVIPVYKGDCYLPSMQQGPLIRFYMRLY